MDDETVLSLTKKRLVNLQKRSQNLEQIAVRLISKNLQYYLKSQDELEQLKNLPGVLRDIILNRVMKRRCLEESGNKEEFADLMEAFPLLLSARTRYIELNGILSFCPDRCENYSLQKVTARLIELLDCIASRAPKVEVLVLRKHHAFGYDTKTHTGEPEILESLKNLHNLKRLHVEIYMFGIFDFLELCKSLPSLQYLNVIIDDNFTAPCAEDVISGFSNLKEFIYVTSKPNYFMRPWFIRHLPKIEVAHFYCNVINLKETAAEDEYSYFPMKYEEESNLRHLYLNLYKSESENGPVHLLFPNTVHIMLDYLYKYHNNCDIVNTVDESYIDNLQKFTKIRSLSFGHFLTEQLYILERFWTTYGQNLHTLNLFRENYVSAVDLKTIFKYCPKLEKLSLINITLKDPSSPIQFFASLKCFKWRFNYARTILKDKDYPPLMTLSNILRAPHLENVDLEGVMFAIKDLRRVAKLIKTKRFLTRLRTFRFFYNYPSKNLSEFQAATEIVKSASAFLPKLIDLKFFASGSKVEKIPRGFFLSGFMRPDLDTYKDPFLIYREYNSEDIFVDESVTHLLKVYENEHGNLQSDLFNSMSEF